MLRMLAELALVLGISLLALWGVLCAIWKKPEVSWYEFMISGPLLFFRPAKYVRPDRARVIRIVVILAFLPFVIGWVMLWLADNS